MITAIPRSVLGWREGSSLLARVVPVADRQGGAALYMVPLNESGLMEQNQEKKGRAEPDDDGAGRVR
jgi:hypothetical protein